MLRILVLLAMVAGVVVFGVDFPETNSANRKQADIDLLKRQRVQILQERVAAIKAMVDLGRVANPELIRPEMDVINAQLDYVDSDRERKKLLKKLLDKYDLLIKLAASGASDPPPIGTDDANFPMRMESERLLLKSERIRIQILHDTIE